MNDFLKPPPRFSCSAALLAILTLSFGSVLPAQNETAEEFPVLAGWMQFTDAPNALYHHLSAEAFSLLDERSRKVAQLRTERDWEERRREVRRLLDQVVGPFPERTPLKVQEAGTVQKDGFRMEKIIFESMPEFFVTGIVFVPDGLTERTPAIVYLSGHAAAGFRTQTYLHVIQNLVRKGFIVFAIDPVGQGERIQHWDPEQGGSLIGGPTLEHSYPGAQCFISGRSLARYMTWDAIRAIDYLVGRGDVDPARIGVTGRSGGGTQSAYVAAMDERVTAAAPENYITSFRRLIQSRGFQDAEQNFFRGIASGIDLADLLVARAPRATLLITTTRDIFSIQGAREVFAEAAPAFAALGREGNLSMVEDDDRHASTLKNREAMYAFFREALSLPGGSEDEEVPDLPAQDLRVTPTGQLATSLRGETIFSLNKTETEPQFAAMQRARSNLRKHLADVPEAARMWSGYREPQEAPQAVFTGRWQRDGFAVETFFMPGEGEYVIPFLVFIPNREGRLPAVLYFDPEGKGSAAAAGGPIEDLVKQGHIVLAPDLIGIGEMGPGVFRGDASRFRVGPVSYNIWFAAMQAGRSITGIRAADIVRTVRYFAGREDVDPTSIAAIARQELGPALLHAANFEPSIRTVALIDPLVSWAELVRHQYYRTYDVPHTVPGALGHYDLPDLAAALAPRRLVVLGVADHQGRPASRELIERELAVVRSSYADGAVPGNLTILPGRFAEDYAGPIGSWLK